ncbi:MAG: RNA-binding protein [Planctomycetota bacterium]
MARKLYVGNLSFGTTSEHLQALFASFGKVDSAQVIMDRDSGRSKGFGFVEMSADQEADAAIEALNGKEHDGRALTVNQARPQSSGGSRREFGGNRFSR